MLKIGRRLVQTCRVEDECEHDNNFPPLLLVEVFIGLCCGVGVVMFNFNNTTKKPTFERIYCVVGGVQYIFVANLRVSHTNNYRFKKFFYFFMFFCSKTIKIEKLEY
jgi:hypothetical protein